MLIAKKRRNYQVKTDIYEGPFDLLLDLISRKKINIHDISIENIAREYNSYLEKLSKFDLEIASEFLLLAATLMEMKASSLFPDIFSISAYEQEIAFPETEEELIRRLTEYKTFKNASMAFAAFYELQSGYYSRESYYEEQYSEMLPNLALEHNVEDLSRIAYELLGSYLHPRMDEAVHIIPKPISVEERKKVILSRLTRIKKLSFSEIVGKNKTSIEMIIDFLALLDLYKEGKVNMEQVDAFGEINVSLVVVKDAELKAGN